MDIKIQKFLDDFSKVNSPNIRKLVNECGIHGGSTRTRKPGHSIYYIGKDYYIEIDSCDNWLLYKNIYSIIELPMVSYNYGHLKEYRGFDFTIPTSERLVREITKRGEERVYNQAGQMIYRAFMDQCEWFNDDGQLVKIKYDDGTVEEYTDGVLTYSKTPDDCEKRYSIDDYPFN